MHIGLTDKLGICRQGRQPSRAQDVCNRFCPAPLGIVLCFGKLGIVELAAQPPSPPALVRGVPPVLKLVAGGVRISCSRSSSSIIFLCLPSLVFVSFLKGMWVTDSPRYQCAHWYHPPHKCGGQGRAPHLPAHHSPNSSANTNLSGSRFKPIRMFFHIRTRLSGCGYGFLRDYSALGPAATRALPASLPVYLTKFFSNRPARSRALVSQALTSA